jgi:flagellar L-ring protein FlgH
LRRKLLFPVLLLLLQACAQAGRVSDADEHFATQSVAFATPPNAANGAIYNAAGTFDLFMDLRAHSVGDILTILLEERTDAAKASSTSTAKGNSVDTGLPTVIGRAVTKGGAPLLNNELKSDNKFDGKSDSSQSNKLDGSITVTVLGKLPNGNLMIRGEKRITINQGEELVRLQGVIRPIDIGPANTVSSTKVADAAITYSGKGTLADSNRPGWLARFFNSPWFPF